jgi:nitrite reductase/ring-hydroxylating ferredoxin subunit
MAHTEGDPYVRAVELADLEASGREVVTLRGRTIALFHHEGAVHAIDNRCPHMGFPLNEGSLEDGVLTCHWHHARFELSCGDTFDPFADDVQTYPVEVRDGTVYVRPDPVRDKPPSEHWRDRLEHGLEENIRLVIAKSVIGLDDADVPIEVPLRAGVEFGTRYREDGWGPGLTTLGVMANLRPALRPADRRRALTVGLAEVASDCAGEPPFFVQDPLSATDVSPKRLTAWFRDNVDVRDADGAERVLRAAIRADLPQSTVAGMFVAALTDHRYLDSGHQLDFANKAFDLLDHVGWEYADQVLPSLVPGLASADRAEERSSWRQPIDVANLIAEAAADLPALLEGGADESWTEPDDFVETLLGGDPHAILDALTDAIAAGASALELARVVAYAAARRVAQFGTANEFRDWNTVHHTYTYANALCGLARRTDAVETYRGVFDAAASVYLDRFLNVPPTPVPTPDGEGDPAALLEDLLETFEVEAPEEVNRAGRLTAQYLAAGGDPDALKRSLGEVLLREDVGFHPRQNLEAAFAQYDDQPDQQRARVHLIGAARYLSAHTPTRRADEQTFRIAERLNRGEQLHEM